MLFLAFAINVAAVILNLIVYSDSGSPLNAVMAILSMIASLYALNVMTGLW